MSNESNLYYFYTVGCGFCKKADPIVDELNKEGHNILKLDLAEKENKEIVEDLKKKYNIQLSKIVFSERLFSDFNEFYKFQYFL